MFGKQRAESVDNADGKFSGLEVCKKGGFHMRSLRALRIVGIGLAFAAILASGGLPVGSQSGQEGQPLPMIAFSYADDMVSYLEVGADGKIVNRVDISVPKGPSGLDIHGQFTYVVSWDASTLAVLDNEARQLIKTVSLGFEVNPYAVAFRPDGQVAYTVNGGTRNITVIDAINHAVLTNIALPGARSPRGLDFHPDGKLAYVSDTETDTVWVIDAVNHRVQETLRTGGQCGAYVKASNTGLWVYIADRCLSRVYALETATKEIWPIQLSGNSGAWYIVFTPNDWVAFVSQTDPRRQISSGKISIIDVAQLKEIGVIDVSLGAMTATALKDGQAGMSASEFAPGSLSVLPGIPDLLAVSPFSTNPFFKLVPFTFDIDPTTFHIVNVGAGSGILVDTGLTRPTSMFTSCKCKTIIGKIGRLQDRRTIREEPKPPTVSITPQAGTARFDAQVTFDVKWFIECTGKKGSCDDTIGWSVEWDPARIVQNQSVKPASVECSGRCNRREEEENIGLEQSITASMQGTHVEQLKKVTISLKAQKCSKEETLWKMIIAIDTKQKDNIDARNSDWDGDGVINNDDNCPWEHRGPQPTQGWREPDSNFRRRVEQWKHGCNPALARRL
jgi:YVTN family beta-propeller protein